MENRETRQQAWYEDSRSIGEKISLAAGLGLAGVGVWTAGGANPTAGEGGLIWDALASYVHGKNTNSTKQASDVR